MPSSTDPCILVTSGEPSGIGPDICIKLANHQINAKLIVLCDINTLRDRAQLLGSKLKLEIFDSLDSDIPFHQPGTLAVHPVTTPAKVLAGRLNTANAKYVTNMLDIAAQACMNSHSAAMVTAPVHKGIINDAGIKFTGHTEYLASKTGVSRPVMMLETEGLRVALVTTHIPLREVAKTITAARLAEIITVLHDDLISKYKIKNPNIYVCGINPHAGEGGHLGDEEQKIIEPVLKNLRSRGMTLTGPLPADTIFSPDNLTKADVFLAMYHDQGLPVLKYRGFGKAINVTLGLPIVRTSVDHGTALSLAGTGEADEHSLLLAIKSALQLVSRAD